MNNIRFDVKKVDLGRLNSTTKYPSILTYHQLGKRGMLLPATTCAFDSDSDDVSVTEKIDGLNARIVLTPDDYFILGTREDFVYGRGDFIVNEKYGLVNTLGPIAERLLKSFRTWMSDSEMPDTAMVIFGELYGGNINAYKQYTGKSELGYRVFDIAVIRNITKFLEENTREKISLWRENGGQEFLRVDDLKNSCEFFELEMVPFVKASAPPTGVKETHEWLKNTISSSFACLDDGGKSDPEGLVVRTHDRKKICKIRFEDYARAQRKGYKA